MSEFLASHAPMQGCAGQGTRTYAQYCHVSCRKHLSVHRSKNYEDLNVLGKGNCYGFLCNAYYLALDNRIAKSKFAIRRSVLVIGSFRSLNSSKINDSQSFPGTASFCSKSGVPSYCDRKLHPCQALTQDFLLGPFEPL